MTALPIKALESAINHSDFDIDKIEKAGKGPYTITKWAIAALTLRKVKHHAMTKVYQEKNKETVFAKVVDENVNAIDFTQVDVSKFDVKVPIDPSKKHETPFGTVLTSRYAIASILSYCGRGPHACELL